MASNLQKRQMIFLYFADAKLQDNVSDGLARTLDLNLPPTNRRSFYGHSIDMITGFNDEVVKETQARCMLGLGMSSNGESSNESYILKLSSSIKQQYSLKESVGSSSSSSASSSSPTPSMLSHIFIKQNPNDEAVSGVESLEDFPLLICMGCVHCHMHIMVPDNAPRCPKCKSIDLLDFSPGSMMTARNN